MRRKFALEDAVPVYLVFLTPTLGVRPANPEAIITSYCDFATAMAVGLDAANLSGQVRPLLKLFVTHLLLHADRRSVGLHNALDRLVRLLSGPEHQSVETQLIADLPAVNLVLDLFGRSENG